ncbi:glucose oxidase [Trichoderma cornu-damae]|uniref:Glucose oxidase n=1 Tax=Trichoderma cornu-damae TaxID=654480 RepID=A0A9P8TRA0_9HYPO|nr:glucose oxidase [Trichoderma cornu-damae]
MSPPKTRFGTLALLTTAAVSLRSLAASTDCSYDYIVVGAGTCGLLVANRLSQDANFTVAVIDPGADQRNNPNVVDPLGWLGLTGTSVDWGYSSIPQESLGGREAVGASHEGEYHGSSGDIHVGFNPDLLNGSFYGSVKESWAALGQGLNKDVNSGATAGFDVWPQTLDPVRNVRWDSATAFYWPVRDRPNLRLLNGTVSKILWKPGKAKTPEASGVEYLTPDGQTATLRARREVIVSAGALRTPLVLELSGIGDPSRLKRLDIETVVNLPGVGENMIDQTNVALFYSTRDSFSGYAPYATFVNASSLFGGDVESVAASTKRSLSRWAQQVANDTGGAVSAMALEHLFRVQHDLIFQSDVTIAEILSSASGSLSVSAYWALLPFSRGSVHLSSASGAHAPEINPRFLSVDFDLAVQVAAGRLSTTFWSTAPASAVVEAQIQPNSTVLPPDATDAQWQSFTVSSLSSNSHSVGTAAMMARELGGVVDSELRVHGTKNVRVVDASVLPMQMSGHLTATLYAVAERAAEFIIQARRS